MTIKVLNDPTHTCELPSPLQFESGTDIECEQPVLKSGQVEPCRRRYTRSRTFWGRRPYWADYDWGW